MGPVIKESLSLTKEYKQAHLNALQQEKAEKELDEEDIEELLEEAAKISKVASQVMECTG